MSRLISLTLLMIMLALGFPVRAQDNPSNLTAIYDEGAGTITLRDANGKTLHVLSRIEMLDGDAFSPGGHYYAAADFFNAAYLWDVQTGEQIAELVMDDINRVSVFAFSPDEKLIAVGGERGEVLRVFDIEALRRGDVEPVLSRQMVAGGITSLAFNSDGTLLAAGAYVDATQPDSLVLLWDMTTHALLLSERVNVMIGSVRFVDGETRLNTMGNSVDYFWDVPPRHVQEQTGCTQHTRSINSICQSPHT